MLMLFKNFTKQTELICDKHSHFSHIFFFKNSLVYYKRDC